MKLRPYQADCVEAIIALFRHAYSTLAVMATGLGKTVCFAHVAHRWQQGRVLVLAHREELIFQACDKIHRITGERPEIEMADMKASRHGLLSRSNVVVSSVQTQNAGARCSCQKAKGAAQPTQLYFGEDGDSGFDDPPPAANGSLETNGRCPHCIDGVVRRMQRFDPFEFGLLIVDEAHHSTAASYRRIINYYRQNTDLKVLGVTATPKRSDESALGQIYQTVAFQYDLELGIDEGYLVPIQQDWIVVSNLDFSKIRTTNGDLNEAELERQLIEEGPIHEVVDTTITCAAGRATLVFAATVAHAELMTEIFNRHSFGSAICIHGGTPTELRRAKLDEYARGKYQYLVGCGVFLEGYDEPRIQVVSMARPTKSLTLYSQAIGRGTRPQCPAFDGLETPEARREAIAASSKPFLTVLDLIGQSGTHKLISSADILGGKFEDAVIEAAVKKAKKSGKPEDMSKLLEQTQAELIKIEKRKVVIGKATFERRRVNPFDLFDVTPSREPGWHKGRQPTEGQLNALRKFKVPELEINKLSFSKASDMIDLLISRIKRKMSSYAQSTLLSKYGIDGASVSHDQASQLLTAIKNNHWQPLSKSTIQQIVGATPESRAAQGTQDAAGTMTVVREGDLNAEPAPF